MSDQDRPDSGVKRVMCRVFADARGQIYLNIDFDHCNVELALLDGMTPEDARAVLNIECLAQITRAWMGTQPATAEHLRVAAEVLASLCFLAEGSKSDENSPEGLRRYRDAVAKARLQWHDASSEQGSGNV